MPLNLWHPRLGHTSPVPLGPALCMIHADVWFDPSLVIFLGARFFLTKRAYITTTLGGVVICDEPPI